jgi:hypothetical protein
MRVPGHQRKSYTWRWTAALAGLAVLAFALVMALVASPAERAQATNFTVDNLDNDIALAKTACTPANTNDCSLRGALSVANGNGVTDTITFAAGLSGTIPITATLAVSEAGFRTVIDGPGGGSTAPSIVIDCGGGAFPGFTVTSPNNTIRGLSIVHCQDGIYINTEPADGNLVAGNWIGLNPSGTVIANSHNGVEINNGADSNTIGGSSAADRNVISGNAWDGVWIGNAASNDNSVRGNYIGTDATGTVAKPNGANGIGINAGTGTIVGGSAAGQGNVISHNSGLGVYVTSPVTIQGNLIGVASDGITPMANGAGGISATAGATDVTIGDTGTSGDMPGANIIAQNGGAGVRISGAGTQRVSVLRNSIFENGGQGIDLKGDSVITQCPPPNGGAAGDGSNGNRDCPAILSVTYASGSFLVAGSANVAEFLTGSRVDIYEVVADPLGAGEGKTWLATFSVANDGTTASWGGNVCVNGPTQITAVATDVNGNSSEFALNVNVPVGTCSPAGTATPTPTVTPTPAATGSPTATPTLTTGAMESVALVAGCNPVASSYADATPIATIAGAVSPSGILISIWKFDPGTSTWLGYSAQAPQASNLTQVDRLDAFFICVSSAGTWSRPII